MRDESSGLNELVCQELRTMQLRIDELRARFETDSLACYALAMAWQALRVAWYVVNQNNDGGKLMFLLQALADYRLRQKEVDGAQPGWKVIRGSNGRKARKG